ncbi:AAA family ATPase [Chondromyces apiculatus]|uniref:Protein with a weak D-galactarate dehydratase/altronate hydrolase domain protein n=1 Tax=Chondromyces apiculatus DSM 436 TaxID=1192034 RepID=A0A017SVV1_9BACT|nr:AAA family ATPase [Chondromyces apiculatus]EYF00745.1 protein with a weak D-galactarate dehydratase/altronate hydrolase domain protein [Chondromyces apiculatus DSM 436]
MPLRPAIGIDDFRRLREDGLAYVDKSHFIAELLDKEGVQVLLLPRPRRFGKTLNLSMLRWFFECRDEDLSSLFADLRIWQAGPHVRAHFQRYPVISLSLKGTKAATYDQCWDALRKKLEVLFDEHRSLLDAGLLSDREQADYRAVLDGTASWATYTRALLDLSAYLHRRHGERVILLLDEYDEPLHAAHVGGYLPQILDFSRAFLTEALKGNPHLFKAVLTGVLRVARENIFSGLNNLAVYTLLATEMRTCFGFTEDEVTSLLASAGRSDLRDPVRAWYDGYRFGGETIYNPWSILSFLDREDKLLRGYWINTSGNDLTRELLQQHALTLEDDFQTLLEGGAIERRLDEHVALAHLDDREDALWSLLVFSGYLKAEPGHGQPGEEPPYRLSIPNREVREVYTTTFRDWLEDRLKAHGGSIRRLTSALLDGDAERVEAQLQAFTADLLSHHDLHPRDPERIYQAFLVGLLAALEPAYQVRSNRESGHGRPDVLIRSAQPGHPGVVLELKVARAGRKTLEQALEEGIDQLQRADYAAELRAAGATPIHQLAVAFDGKRVRVAAASL